MTYNEFRAIVVRYDPSIDGITDILQGDLVLEIHAARTDLFSNLEKSLWDRLQRIASQRVSSSKLFKAVGDDIGPVADIIQSEEYPENDTLYEFTEKEFQSAEVHALEAVESLINCEVGWLHGMLVKATQFSQAMPVTSESRH